MPLAKVLLEGLYANAPLIAAQAPPALFDVDQVMSSPKPFNVLNRIDVPLELNDPEREESLEPLRTKVQSGSRPRIELWTRALELDGRRKHYTNMIAASVVSR